MGEAGLRGQCPGRLLRQVMFTHHITVPICVRRPTIRLQKVALLKEQVSNNIITLFQKYLEISNTFITFASRLSYLTKRSLKILRKGGQYESFRVDQGPEG